MFVFYVAMHKLLLIVVLGVPFWALCCIYDKIITSSEAYFSESGRKE